MRLVPGGDAKDRLFIDLPTYQQIMTLNLYFLRHGQTASSRGNLFCGSIDPALTDDGEEMAELFAKAYASTTWQAIYCSPKERAILTAEPLANALKMELQLRDGLQEINYGAWEGKDVATVDLEFHDDYLRWLADPGWNPPTGGESAMTIAARALAVIEEISQKYSDGNVLVVSHKATIRILLCSLLGIDAGRFRYRLGMPVSSISIVEFSTHGPLLKVLADRSHLTDRLRALPGT
jgi:broad specificity phosphatase PhoE